MTGLDRLRAAFEAFATGRAMPEDNTIVREAIAAERVQIVTGERASQIGGDAHGATVVTGDGNFLLTVNASTAAAMEQAIAALFRSSPNQLPADLPDFQGRREQIERLKEILTCGGQAAITAITAIGGMGGIGKSALALHVGHQLEDEAPDRRIFVDMGGTSSRPLTPVDAMVRVVAALAPAAEVPKEEDAAARAYRSVLDGRRVLLLLDNAESTAQVKPLLEWRAPMTMVIVTSRRTITAPGLEPLDLEVMTPDEARALLRSALGGRNVSENDLDALAERCGRLPLALRVAGTFLAQSPEWSIAEYLNALMDETRRLVSLKVEDDAQLDVYAVLGLSADKLAEEKPELAARWQLLSVFPASFDLAAVAAVWETGEDETRQALGDLRRRSVILYDVADGRWRLHDLMRDVAQVPLGGENAAAFDARLDAARFRHARHYCGVLSSVNALYLKGGDGVLAGLALYDLEQHNITAGQACAVAQLENSDGAARLAADYAAAGCAMLHLRLHAKRWTGWLEAQRRGCVRLGDRRGECNALGNLGNACYLLGEPTRAMGYHEQQVAIAREIGDRQGEASGLGNLGLEWHALGHSDRTFVFNNEALKISIEIDDRRGEAAALGNLGLAWAALGETRRAIGFYEQQLQITRAIGDRRGEGHALGNLAVGYKNLNEPWLAIEHYKQVLNIMRDIGDRRVEGDTLGSLANVWLIANQPRRAIEHQEQALEIAREVGDRMGEAHALFNSALALDQLGEREKAVRQAREALSIVESIGAEHLVANARATLAAWGVADSSEDA